MNIESRFARALVLAAGLLASCAMGPPLKDRFSEAQPREKDGVVVYVYRMPSMVGAAVPWAVRLDGARVASVRTGTYTVVRTSAGPHSITIGDLTPTLLGVVLDITLNKAGALETRPNGVYFLRNSGFEANFVSRDVAMKEIVDLMFDPSP